MAKAHTDERGMTLLLMDEAEAGALAALLNAEAGDDGPLLELLEALAPTWTQEVDYLPCVGCGDATHEDEVVWAMPDGRLTTTEGQPYCTGCLPAEPGL